MGYSCFLDILKLHAKSLKYRYVDTPTPVKPYLGNTPITRVNYDSVEQFIEHCQGKKVSIPTSRKTLITLGAILTYSCRKKYIAHNPIREIEKPKGNSEHDENGEMDILLPDQIRKLLYATEDLMFRTLFMTAIFTGMREGEILGLKWEDFDWISNQVHVKRTFNHGEFYEPKTKASKRKIDMAPQLVVQLKEWKLACPTNAFDLVFPNGKGKPINANNLVNRAFYPALKQVELPKIRFHNLRHTYASLLIDQGEHPKYIQS